MNKHPWHKINVKLVLHAVVAVAGLVISSLNGNVRHGSIDSRLLVLIGVLLFVGFATAFLQVLSDGIRQTIIAHRCGIGRGAAAQFMVRIIGYIVVFFTALDYLGVPIEHLLLGSAVLGIILGVAAQQALANFFASVVLIISHPFAVGEEITLVSGGLGGKYVGTIVDIGLTHTHLQEKDGTRVALPNATLLSGAAIIPQNEQEAEKATDKTKRTEDT